MLINSGNYLIAILLTIAIEIIVALFFGYRKKIEIVTFIFINLITNPLLNYFLFINNYFTLVHINTIIILFLEIIVVFIEWLLLMFALQQNSKKLFALSAIMNFFSYVVGVFVFK